MTHDDRDHHDRRPAAPVGTPSSVADPVADSRGA